MLLRDIHELINLSIFYDAKFRVLLSSRIYAGIRNIHSTNGWKKKKQRNLKKMWIILFIECCLARIALATCCSLFESRHNKIITSSDSISLTLESLTFYENISQKKRPRPSFSTWPDFFLIDFEVCIGVPPGFLVHIFIKLRTFMWAKKTTLLSEGVMRLFPSDFFFPDLPATIECRLIVLIIHAMRYNQLWSIVYGHLTILFVFLTISLSPKLS